LKFGLDIGLCSCMAARLLQQHPVKNTDLEDDDKEAQLYDLLDTKSPKSPPPLFTELGVLILLPVFIWCLVSWALSYVGCHALLAKFSLFGFLPAAASAFACERIRQLRIPPSELAVLRDENEGFKASNAELKAGVDLLRAENQEARNTNRQLESSVADLHDVRASMEKYAQKQGTDFGQVLESFKQNLTEQQALLQTNAEIQQRTRKLAEAQWRGLLLNLYAQAKESTTPGMTRREFKLWLAMLPGEISSKLSDETFESIDSTGDDCIDVSEMCNFVQGAVNAHLNSLGGGVGSESPPPAEMPALSSPALSSVISEGLSSVYSDKQAPPYNVGVTHDDKQCRVVTEPTTAEGLSVTDCVQGCQSPHEVNDLNESASPARTLRWQSKGARPKFSDSYLQRLFGQGSTMTTAPRSGGESQFASL